MKSGLFITFEGPEGGGKTTQARKLIDKLKQKGYEVVFTREPGGTILGERIRDLLQHGTFKEPICPESEVLLFAASRAQLVHEVIGPALAKGAVVVSDRFMDSTTVYQGFGRGISLEKIFTLHSFAIGGIQPHITLLLDVDVEAGMKRLRHRQAEKKPLDRIEQEDRSFHEKVRQGYLDLARRWPERIHLLDGMRSEELMEAKIWSIIQKVLRK